MIKKLFVLLQGASLFTALGFSAIGVDCAYNNYVSIKQMLYIIIMLIISYSLSILTTIYLNKQPVRHELIITADDFK